MCRAVTCKQCGKTTWAGCGMHVDQVLAKVPAAQRCTGHTSKSSPTPSSWKPSATTGTSSQGATTESAKSRGLLSRLRGR